MKELPKKLEENFQECEICIKNPGSPQLCNLCLINKQNRSKINEIISYLESQKEGEEPKQIDVVKLCDELYGLGRWYDRCLNPEESEGRKKEIINTLKALQQ